MSDNSTPTKGFSSLTKDVNLSSSKGIKDVDLPSTGIKVVDLTCEGIKDVTSSDVSKQAFTYNTELPPLARLRYHILNSIFKDKQDVDLPYTDIKDLDLHSEGLKDVDLHSTGIKGVPLEGSKDVDLPSEGIEDVESTDSSKQALTYNSELPPCARVVYQGLYSTNVSDIRLYLEVLQEYQCLLDPGYSPSPSKRQRERQRERMSTFVMQRPRGKDPSHLHTMPKRVATKK